MMKSSLLSRMVDIARLQDIARGRESGMDVTELEKDFLTFSHHTPGAHLSVNVPNLYTVRGDEKEHINEVLAGFGRPAMAQDAIDVSGASDFSLDDELIIVSPAQFRAEPYDHTRAWMNPILREVYISGAQLLNSFTIHCALAGKVRRERGGVKLEEVHLFPDRFTPGNYLLEVTLDSADHLVGRHKDFKAALDELEREPRKLLDVRFLDDLTREGVQLRERLGPLGRYKQAENTFRAHTDACIATVGDTTLFYLYDSKHRENICVYFGDDIFVKKPRGLTVLDGNNHHHTLRELLGRHVFMPSAPVLSQRITDLERLYDGAARGMHRPILGEHGNAVALLKHLKGVQSYFQQVVNDDMRHEYSMRQPPETLEFMLCPSTPHPVVHALLPRLSWSADVRRYHNTDHFMSDFSQADEQDKRDMLGRLGSSIAFQYQQNMDANLWLYEHHQDFCEDAGIVFDVL